MDCQWVTSTSHHHPHLTLLVQQWVITKTGHSEIATRDILEQHCLCLAFRRKGPLITHLCLLEETWCVIMSQWVCHLFWSHYRGRGAYVFLIWALLTRSRRYRPETSYRLTNKRGWAHLCLVTVSRVLHLLFLRKPSCCIITLLPVPTAEHRAVG